MPGVKGKRRKMQVETTIPAVRKACGRARLAVSSQGGLGLVPTMGALHEGHLSLVRKAKRECELVVATIFVNPLQFGAGEDLERYPRQMERDCALLEKAGVDVVFVPSVAEMYPRGAVTTVEVGGLSERLDGASRPGHFRGVATVVTKLLHIVRPDKAYFGQKDAVQVAVLRQMVRDLNFDVELVTGQTVRDPDGLALSSRNVYLSAAERREALALPRALEAMQEAIAEGKRERAAVLRAGTNVLKREPGVKVEYLEAVDWATLEGVETIGAGTLVAVAARVGTTRLIDNFLAG
jgi:pantoate--beta-alanine ligase